MAEKLPTYQDTTATKKIFQLNKRIRAVTGGTAASKTISILIWLIDYCQTVKNEVVTVVAESFPHLQLGVIRDLRNIMVSHGYWDDRNWNASKSVYTFHTGSIIEFVSFDKFGKAHGPRRDVLYVNEANNLSYNIVDQLMTRTRKIIWLDWNPTSEFWFYTELLPNRKDEIDFITLTYKDNEALDSITVREIESHKNNKQWWTVYGLGQLGTIESRIYSGWNIIDEIPFEARLERRGIDFGYSSDPTAIVDIYWYNGGYILDEVIYQKGMSNREIADVLKERGKCLNLADSAEPKSIDEIRSYGIQILGAIKGPGSVEQGIAFIRDQKISVTSRSTNIIKEYRNYLYITDKDGRVTNEPEDINNHAMDATRYGFSKSYQRTEVTQSKPTLSVYGSRHYSPGLRPR